MSQRTNLGHKEGSWRLAFSFQVSLLQKSLGVIPAEAGIQVFQPFLDPGFRRGDGI